MGWMRHGGTRPGAALHGGAPNPAAARGSCSEAGRARHAFAHRHGNARPQLNRCAFARPVHDVGWLWLQIWMRREPSGICRI